MLKCGDANQLSPCTPSRFVCSLRHFSDPRSSAMNQTMLPLSLMRDFASWPCGRAARVNLLADMASDCASIVGDLHQAGPYLAFSSSQELPSLLQILHSSLYHRRACIFV